VVLSAGKLKIGSETEPLIILFVVHLAKKKKRNRKKRRRKEERNTRIHSKMNEK
jgi:hypothetical protein